MKRLGTALLTSVLIAWGCGDDASSELSGGASGSGAASGTSSSSGFISGSSTGSGNFEECATATLEGEPIPVTMYIMFDRSGSMLFDQKWAGAKTALIAFFQDEASAGLTVALRFFPDDEPVAGCDDKACSASACAVPLVDAGELNALPAHSDPQQKALVAAVNSKDPDGQTPMHAAISGATQWAVANASADGSYRTTVVLVTDGKPNGCVNTIDEIAAVAGDALTQADVLTYAIGMDGADKTQLDKIALAGGTDDSFVIKKGTVHKDLAEALKKIRKTQLDCSFALPEAEGPGDELDPTKINVTYTPGGGEQQTIGKVSSAGACAGAGWYYDDTNDPKSIELCPLSCEQVQSDPDTVVQIVVGCETVLK